MNIRKNLMWFFILNTFVLIASLFTIISVVTESSVGLQGRFWIVIPMVFLTILTLFSGLTISTLIKDRNFYLTYDELTEEIAKSKKSNRKWENYLKIIGQYEASKLLIQDISAPRAKYLFGRLNTLKFLIEKNISTSNTHAQLKARESEIVMFARAFPEIGDKIKELRKAEVKTTVNKEVKIVDAKQPFKDSK